MDLFTHTHDHYLIIAKQYDDRIAYDILTSLGYSLHRGSPGMDIVEVIRDVMDYSEYEAMKLSITLYSKTIEHFEYSEMEGVA